MRRELMKEMLSFACRGFTHPTGEGEIEQFNNLSESHIVESEDEKLKDR